MSLFGGDSSVPPTESEYESESDNPIPSAERASPTTDLRNLQNAQDPQAVHYSQELGQEEAAHDVAGNDADSEESDEEPTQRPNRFKGPLQTWKGYTAVDRQAADSLQQLEDTDLSAHLYNAHALKRRARRPAEKITTLSNWRNKDAWLRQGKELQYTDAGGQTQTELIPSKDWTAWPLPPTSLFTLDNGFRRAAVVPEADEWVIGGSGQQDPGEELKEEMLGLFLRTAKNSWNAKEYQDENQRSARKAAKTSAKSRSKSAQEISDTEMKDVGEDDAEDDEEEVAQAGATKRGRKPQAEMDFKPAILADDMKAQRLLRPTIASVLSKLDDVALSLQRTRHNHFGRGAFGDESSQSDFATDAETTGRESRSRSRSMSKNASQKQSTARILSRPTSGRSSRAINSPKQSLKVQTEPQDSDSASDYGAQFDNETDHRLHESRSPVARRKRSRSESTIDEDDVSTTRDWSRAGLMDWSEVLGIAAVSGWNQKALDRTAQRCAALFGESMSFRPFHEDLATKPSFEPVQYTPSTIPVPGQTTISAHRSAKRPYFQTGTIRCPHTDCFGHKKDFAVAYRVIEHCMRIHGYDPRTNDSDNEERTHGGVHIDGFLQPITAKQGWLGHGRSKAGGKKRKIENTELSGATSLPAEGNERGTS